MEVVLWDAVVASEVSFGLVPEVLDPVDVVAVFGKQLRVVDPDMMEVRDIEDIISPEAVRVDDTGGPYFTLNDGEERF